MGLEIRKKRTQKDQTGKEWRIEVSRWGLRKDAHESKQAQKNALDHIEINKFWIKNRNNKVDPFNRTNENISEIVFEEGKSKSDYLTTKIENEHPMA